MGDENEDLREEVRRLAEVNAELLTGRLAEMVAVQGEIRDLVKDGRSYVPQENAAEMLLSLERAKVTTDKGNTLWALVHRVIEERDEARQERDQLRILQAEQQRAFTAALEFSQQKEREQAREQARAEMDDILGISPNAYDLSQAAEIRPVLNAYLNEEVGLASVEDVVMRLLAKARRYGEARALDDLAPEARTSQTPVAPPPADPEIRGAASRALNEYANMGREIRAFKEPR